VLRLRNLSAVVTAGILVISSCSKTTIVSLKLSSTDIKNVSLESAADLYLGEPVGLANSITQNIGDSVLGVNSINLVYQGKTLKKWDKRLACATVSVTSLLVSTPANPQGSITIYYDSTANCSDTTGVQRKGTIAVTYSGLRYGLGSTRELTYRGYSRSGVRIRGTCMITNLTDSVIRDSLTNIFKYAQVVNGGSVTFSDGKTITRNQNFTAQWNRALRSLPDTIIHYFSAGTASGIIQDSAAYQMVINEDVYYSGPCLFGGTFTPINGSKTMRVGSTIYYISYGMGICTRNQVTVTMNGLSKSITVSP
jgi:hypothetical protein